MAEAEGQQGARWRVALRALRHRNYRLFFIGQGLSLIGTWMQIVATGWLVHRLTGSAQMLGAVGFANLLPCAILTPLAGVLIDRHNKHKIVILMQALAMLLAFVLAGLTLSGVILIWHIFVVSVGQGIVRSIEVPARQSFFIELLEDREDLSNAVALNSSLFNLARLAGPAIAGYVIAHSNEGVCFLLNALSFVAILAALLRMDVVCQPTADRSESVLANLREGLTYAVGYLPLRLLLSLVALTALFAMPYRQMMPVYVKDLLGLGSRELGLVLSAGGAGALAGALYLAQRRTTAGLERLIPEATCVFGLSLALFAVARQFPLALALSAAVSAGAMVQMAATNTVLQTLVDDDKRGRVMSIYTMSNMGVTPFGELLVGVLAERYGLTGTLVGCGLVTLLIGLLFLRPVRRLAGLLRDGRREALDLGDVARAVRAANEGVSREKG